MNRSAAHRRPLLSRLRPTWQLARTTLLVIGLSTAAGAATAASGSAAFCGPTAATAQPLPWLTDAGAAPALAPARETLLASYTHGLDPASFDADELAARAEALLARLDENEDFARADRLHEDLRVFNRQMTGAVACYLAQVRLGMLDPRSLHKDIDIPARHWSPVEALSTAWQDRSVADLLATTYPTDKQYQQLRETLTQYRAMAELEQARAPLTHLPESTLRPGMRDLSVAALRDRLVFLGDMTISERDAAEALDTVLFAAGESADANNAQILAPLYDEVTEQAVRRFQQRHGLTADGIVGTQSLQALRTPMYMRVAQIEMAMERLRWLPDLPEHNVVRVNLPEFRLTVSTGEEALESRVVIGKSVRHPTPIYIGKLKRIEFSPYWNVPWSIAKRELVPKMMRDLSRMQRQHMEIVTRDGNVHTAASKSLLQKVANGQARMRQRPGKHNALGRYKFVLPNPRGIFLHDTRSVSLFNRDRRDFSHGCVRVEQPLDLARLALHGNEDWDQTRVEQASRSRKPIYAIPEQAMTVVFTYQTVSVSADGQTRFLPDVYGYDPRTVRSVERWANINADNVNATARNTVGSSKLASLNL